MKYKPIKMVAALLVRTLIITMALLLFFSMMAGMYYKNEPRAIRTVICDEDGSALSRSIIFGIRSADTYHITGLLPDYHAVQEFIDQGKADLGVVIPHEAYKDVLNHRSVKIVAILNGTANPIIPKIALGMLNKIIMTFTNQLSMHIRVEDLGAIPNYRHAPTPLLSVSERVYYSPTMSMEASMLPAFMGLAMQIVSMLIILFALRTSLAKAIKVHPRLNLPRKLPVKSIIVPIITSWLIVGTAISTAFFTTMYLFGVPLPEHPEMVVGIIFLFVLAMESISLFIALNIKNVIILATLITLIVMPAFMYSGFLVPPEQMATFPYTIGGLFPLRNYLKALYSVFHHTQNLTQVSEYLRSLGKFIVLFISLSLVSIIMGSFERRTIYRKHKYER